MAKYIRRRIAILNQLHIWEKLSTEEIRHLREAKTEIAADNIIRTFRNKYL